MNTMTPHPLTLDEFSRLPPSTIVAKTWPYQGENAEPEIWQRLKDGNYWADLTDFNSSHRDQYAPDAAYCEGAVHLIVWQPTTDETAAIEETCLVTGLSPCPWHPGGGNHPEAGK